MAVEMGMGVTPWSPLKSGVLSGKYTRANAGKDVDTQRAWSASALNETTYAVLDELEKVAKSLDSTVARVALAWVQNRPGVSSTIIGARTMKHLDDNLAALDVVLTAEQTAKLDALTKPTLNFPGAMMPMFPAIHQGGTSVNGERMDPTPWGVTKLGDHY